MATRSSSANNANNATSSSNNMTSSSNNMTSSSNNMTSSSNNATSGSTQPSSTTPAPHPPRQRGGLPRAYGALAPPKDIGFPIGDMTATEIIAFFPGWLKAPDVINRICNNGASAIAIANMVNAFINTPAPLLTNTILYTLKNAMSRAGVPNWTFRMHRDRLVPRRWATDWSTYIDTTDFRTQSEMLSGEQGTGVVTIQFKYLVCNLKAFPTGDDALDLTRMVHYAATHQTERWVFPNDWDRLLAHIGGPKAVTTRNHDGEVFARWSPRNAIAVNPVTRNTLPVDVSAYETETEMDEDDVPDDANDGNYTPGTTPNTSFNSGCAS